MSARMTIAITRHDYCTGESLQVGGEDFVCETDEGCPVVDEKGRRCKAQPRDMTPIDGHPKLHVCLCGRIYRLIEDDCERCQERSRAERHEEDEMDRHMEEYRAARAAERDRADMVDAGRVPADMDALYDASDREGA